MFLDIENAMKDGLGSYSTTSASFESTDMDSAGMSRKYMISDSVR